MYKNRVWLYAQYIVKKKSSREIAKLCNVNKQTILNYLHKYSFNRSQKEAFVVLNDKREKLNYMCYDWLYKHYILKEKSASDVASLCNTNKSIILRNLRKFGLNRTHKDALILRDKKIKSKKTEKYIDYDWLYEQYITLEKNGTEIADMCKCGSSTIYLWLDKLAIERRDISDTLRKWYEDNEISEETIERMSSSHIGINAGAKHPNWQGGITPKTTIRVTRNIWKKISKKIRERDKYRCQECGKKGDNVHHILPSKLGGPDEDWNLVTLCRSCHAKIEHQEGCIKI